MHLFRLISICLFFPLLLPAQQKDLNYFIDEGIKNSPNLTENANLRQFFQVQNELINAQNKKPQVNFTGDYLFAPFFFDDGKPISITNNPSPKAYGYDVGITNGGLYSAQVNVVVPLFNTSILKNLYDQNKVAADISQFSRGQLEQDLKKNISEQYILTYQFQVQGTYLQKIIDQLENRKPLIAALVKQGLLQQNDYLLLDIQVLTSMNELKQLQFSYNSGLAQLKTLTSITDTFSFKLDSPSVYIKLPPKEYYYEQKFRLDSLKLVVDQNVSNSKYKPQVSLTGSSGFNATDIRNIHRNIGISAAVHVGIPIYDGKQRKLVESQNAILLKNLQAYRDNAARLIQNNLRGAMLQIQQWKQTIDLLDQQIKKQELLLEIIREKVIKGQVTVMDYINALQDYAVSQKNLAIAKTNVMLYTNQYNYYNW